MCGFEKDCLYNVRQCKTHSNNDVYNNQDTIQRNQIHQFTINQSVASQYGHKMGVKLSICANLAKVQSLFTKRRLVCPDAASAAGRTGNCQKRNLQCSQWRGPHQTLATVTLSYWRPPSHWYPVGCQEDRPQATPKLHIDLNTQKSEDSVIFKRDIFEIKYIWN